MITKYLIEKSQGILRQVPEYRDEGKGYMAFNDGSVECEVGDFLYGITRIQRPVFVLETGTYKGISSSYIGQALKDNGRGKLDTLEIADEHIQTAKQLWTMLELNQYITSHKIESFKFESMCNYDLIFLDSEMNLRLHELVKFYPILSDGGYAFVHDMPATLCEGNINPDHSDYVNWPVGPIPFEIKQYLKEDKLRFMTFSNPRGMVGFYKPLKKEFK